MSTLPVTVFAPIGLAAACDYDEECEQIPYEPRLEPIGIMEPWMDTPEGLAALRAEVAQCGATADLVVRSAISSPGYAGVLVGYRVTVANVEAAKQLKGMYPMYAYSQEMPFPTRAAA